MEKTLRLLAERFRRGRGATRDLCALPAAAAEAAADPAGVDAAAAEAAAAGADAAAADAQLAADAASPRALAPEAVAPRLWALFCALGPRPLSDPERRRVGGLLFRGAPQVVRGVAAALEERPDLFHDAADRAARLRGADRRARLWRALHLHLARMARLAADSHLREQAGAISLALSIIEEARHAAASPALTWQDRLPGARISQQQLALRDALSVLRLRQQRKRKARLTRRRRQRALARGAAPHVT